MTQRGLGAAHIQRGPLKEVLAMSHSAASVGEGKMAKRGPARGPFSAISVESCGPPYYTFLTLPRGVGAHSSSF